MKRFWDHATLEAEPGGFVVMLDGRPMRVPNGGPLHLSSRLLGEAIAAEWDGAGGGKGGEMSFADVPLTRLAGTAQERIAPDPAPVVDALARYAESDLLCYRADAPAALAQREALMWQPWLDWAETEFGARLRPTAGVMHVAQDAAALAALRHAVAALDAYALAGLGIAVPSLGSLVLGLALAHGQVDAAEAHALATLDETFQEEFWGQDAEAAQRRRAVGADVELAERFMRLSRS